MDKPQGMIDLDFKLRRAGLILLYLVIVCLAGFVLYQAKPAIRFVLTILSPFIVALIIAYIFNPLVSWLQRKFHIGRIFGVIITYTIILAITAGFFALLVPILYTQLREGITSLVTNFPRVVEKANSWLRLRVSPEEMAQAREFMRQHLDLQEITGRASTALNQAVDTTRLISRAVGTAISLTIGFFAFITFVVVICFYFLLDYHKMEHVARVLLPDDKESRVFGIWRKIDMALGGYLRGQMIVVTVIFCIYSVVLFAMGMREYAILIGFLAGFGNLIPYLGPVLGGVPAGLWILFGNTYDGSQAKLLGIGGIILLSVAVQTLDGFFLQPRIVGKNAEIHPLLVLLALLIGAQFGIGGMIIAVPLAIIARVVIKEIWWDPLEHLEYASKRQAGKINSPAYDVPSDMNLPVPVETPRARETAAVAEVIAQNIVSSAEETQKSKRRRRRKKK